MDKNISLRDAATVLMGAKPDQWREFAALVQGRIDEIDQERQQLQRLLRLAGQFAEPEKKSAPQPITEEQREEIYRLADEGMDVKAIATQMGLSHQQVGTTIGRRKHG